MSAHTPTLRIVHIPAQRYDAAKGLSSLDPVTAFLQDFEPGRGQLTLVCWERAWTYFWGAMGDGSTVAEFVGRASTRYLVGKLMLPSDVMLKRAERREDQWVNQIIEGLKNELIRAAIASEKGGTA